LLVLAAASSLSSPGAYAYPSHNSSNSNGLSASDVPARTILTPVSSPLLRGLGLDYVPDSEDFSKQWLYPVSCFSQMHVASAYSYRIKCSDVTLSTAKSAFESIGLYLEDNAMCMQIALTTTGQVDTASWRCSVPVKRTHGQAIQGDGSFANQARLAFGVFSSSALRTTCSFKLSGESVGGTNPLDAHGEYVYPANYSLPTMILFVQDFVEAAELRKAQPGESHAQHVLLEQLLQSTSSEVCRVPVEPILRPSSPTMFMLGVTQVRSVADHIIEWLVFALHTGGMDHVVRRQEY
jgi:hypothetical protein